MPTCRVLPADADGIAQAAALLSSERLVAFPTETVYGLGADARNGEAVAGIYAAKGRPSFNPLISHVAGLDMATRFGTFGQAAKLLARAFWPGPMTLVVPAREGGGLSSLALAGLPTVALRVPAHPVAQALLGAFDGPLAAPSANPSGRISPTTSAHVVDGLNDRIDAVLDGGPCEVGLESTILDCSADRVALLRPGGLAVEQIDEVLGYRPLAADISDQPTAPGQLASHYAPGAPVRMNAEAAATGGVFLGFGPGEPYTLSPGADLTEAAAQLFAMLHQLDALNPTEIAVAPIPETGLGHAINDRLRRAAAPREKP